MRWIIGLLLPLLAVQQASAQTATQVVPGINSTTGCPSAALVPCFIPYSAANPMPVSAPVAAAPAVSLAIPSATDPCSGVPKASVPISQTASTQIIAGASAKKTYICSIFVFTAGAQSLSVVEGTGTVCATNMAAVLGGTTADKGPKFAANQGFSLGNGMASVAIAANAAADNVCLLLSGTKLVAGVLTYVQN